MKLKLIILLLLFSSCFAKTKIELLEIYDGDTIKAKIDKEFFSLRLKGLDCYETSTINRAYKQAYEDNLKIEEVITKGNLAKEYLASLYNKTSNVYFEFFGIDKHSRALGVLYFDKMNINKKLIEENVCKKYNYYSD